MARGWLLFSTLLVISLSISVESFGVNWGTKTSHPLHPKTVVQMLKDNGINKVKFFDVDSAILNELAGSGFDVMIGLPNLRLAEMGDYNKAKEWVKENVTAYKPASKDGVNITMVGVGNEPFMIDYKDKFMNATLPALQNIQKALDEAGLGHIKATVPLNGDVYSTPDDRPVPSAGRFRPDINDAMVEIVKALDKSKAPFMLNINPFLSVFEGKGNFPMDYAFFDGVKTPVVDGNVKYENVYDANLDMLTAALTGAGFGKMPIVVGEAGWPTDGDINANTKLAARFNNGLMKKLSEGKGTALRPGNTEVYLFGLFDEDTESIFPGNYERHWGLFTYDGKPKYELDLSGGNKKFMTGAKDVKFMENKWCRVKEDVKDKKALDEAITIACEKADCTALEIGSSCSSLDDKGKASYALNNYFQIRNQDKEICDFGGLAEVTDKNISQGTCNFIIQLADVPTAAPSEEEKAAAGPAKESASPEIPLQMAMAFFAVILASIVLT